MEKSDLKTKLDEIASVHIKPHAAHLLDNKVLAHDMEKMFSYVIGPEILEMGFGDGVWTEKIVQTYGHSQLVDASSRLCKKAKDTYGNNITCYESFFEVFSPPEDKHFNTIIATHIFEHVKNPSEVLKRTKDWLANDGRMIIIVPNAASIHRRLAVMMGIQKTIYDLNPRDHEVGHLRVYDLPSLEKDIDSAGFDIVYRRGLFLKVLPNSMMTEFPDSLIKALVDISDDMPIDWMANLAIVVKPRRT